MIWKIRHLKRDALQRSIEATARRMVGNLKRTASSVAELIENVDTDGRFNQFIYIEVSHKQVFSLEQRLKPNAPEKG